MKRSIALACAIATAAAGCSHGPPDARVTEEIAAREAYGRAVAIDAGAERMLRVASRSDVMFEEGFSLLLYDPPNDYHNHAFRWMGKNGHVRLHPHGDKPMKLRIAGWIHEKVIHSKPVITAYIDGQPVEATKPIDAQGHYELEKVIPAWFFHGREWVDLNLLCNAVGFHWSDPPQLNVVVLYDLSWAEAP